MFFIFIFYLRKQIIVITAFKSENKNDKVKYLLLSHIRSLRDCVVWDILAEMTLNLVRKSCWFVFDNFTVLCYS